MVASRTRPVTSGPELFCRFAFPPNLLGYCGPSDTGLVGDLLRGGNDALVEMRHAAVEFSGAWPYLELISGIAGSDPLDYRVVEAYWLGNSLLQRIDLQTMGNSIADRFKAQAGPEWEMVARTLGSPARPTHSFHVFCVYPWVGLLRSGVIDQALRVLDRCRIRWGTVVARENQTVVVTTRLLTWDGRSLALGEEETEEVRSPADAQEIQVGDQVAMHWDYVCQRISDAQLHSLETYQAMHMGLANQTGKHLARRVER
jgi:hypothetical protein